jgi:thioredoxin-like negative regulator of GroEL
VRRAGEKLHLATARSDDVQALLEAFRLSSVPAVVLADRTGEAVERWEKAIPADLWPQVERTSRRLRAAEEEAGRRLVDARTALDRGDPAEALGHLARVRAVARKGYPAVAEGTRLEAELLARASEDLRAALGAEGIADDRELQAALLALRLAYPHPAFTDLIDREVARLKARKVRGGRSAR